MKINTRVCDVCGESVYKFAKHNYVIKKITWWTGDKRRIDLCEDCYRSMVKWIKGERKEE